MPNTDKITKARITALPQSLYDPLPEVWVRVDDRPEEKLFEYYPDELTFTTDEFIGLTLAEARDLKRQKDVAYLQSPDEAQLR